MLAPDFLGHGASEKPLVDYSLGNHASAMRDFLNLLRIDRATVVGQSWVGGVAMQFAYQFPERCERPGQSRKSRVLRIGRLAAGIGSAVILGHVDSYLGPAVFFELRTLRAGDKVNVNLADGVLVHFRVPAVSMYPKVQFPSLNVYGSLGHSALQLVTCGGVFDYETRHYLPTSLSTPLLWESRRRCGRDDGGVGPPPLDAARLRSDTTRISTTSESTTASDASSSWSHNSRNVARGGSKHHRSAYASIMSKSVTPQRKHP